MSSQKSLPIEIWPECDEGTSVCWLLGDYGGPVFGHGRCTPEDHTDEETGSSSLYCGWGSAWQAHIPLSIKKVLEAEGIFHSPGFHSLPFLKKNPFSFILEWKLPFFFFEKNLRSYKVWRKCQYIYFMLWIGQDSRNRHFSCFFSLNHSSPHTVYGNTIILC